MLNQSQVDESEEIVEDFSELEVENRVVETPRSIVNICVISDHITLEHGVECHPILPIIHTLVDTLHHIDSSDIASSDHRADRP